MNESASGDPNPALVRLGGEGSGSSLTRAGLARRAERLGRAFAASGLQSGDRLALWAENDPQWLVVDLATARAGLVLVPLFPWLCAEEAGEQIRSTGARACFVSGPDRAASLASRGGELPSVEIRVVLAAGEDRAEGWAELEPFLETGDGEAAELPAEADTDLVALQLDRDETGELRAYEWTSDRWAANQRALEAVPMAPESTFFCCRSLAGVEERLLCDAALTRGVRVVFPHSSETALEELRETGAEILSLDFSHGKHLMNRVFAEVQRNGPRRQKLFQQAVQVGREALDLRLRGEELPEDLERRWLAADRWAFSRIRGFLGGRAETVVVTGTPFTQGWLTFFWAAGVPIFEGYTTDRFGWIAGNRPTAKRLESAGPLLPGVEARFDSEHRLETRFHPESAESAAEWIPTGELARLDVDGFLTVEGSAAEAWERGGTRLSPSRIARTFAANHWIDHVLVARGRDDAPVALVVPDFEALSRLAKAHGLTATTPAELCAENKVLGFLDYQIRSINETLDEPMRIESWEYLHRELEAHELTSRCGPRASVLQTASEEFLAKLA